MRSAGRIIRAGEGLGISRLARTAGASAGTAAGADRMDEGCGERRHDSVVSTDAELRTSPDAPRGRRD